jgi:hypothetical protein
MPSHQRGESRLVTAADETAQQLSVWGWIASRVGSQPADTAQ